MRGSDSPVDKHEAFYRDGSYMRKNPSWHVEDSRWKAHQVARLLARNSIVPRTVGEVGCGAGELLAQLSDMLPPCTLFEGYEISEQAYAMCQDRAGGNVSFRHGNIFTCGRMFDLVLAIDVFEHVANYPRFLTDLRTVGTYRIFHVPLDISVQSSLMPGVRRWKRNQFGHLHYFTRRSALAALRDAGHVVQDCFHTYAPIRFERGHPVQFLLRHFKNLLFRGSPPLMARLLDGFSMMVLTTD